MSALPILDPPASPPPPAPVLASFADRLYRAMAPLATWDASCGYALANLDGAVGEMFQAVEDLARDTPAGPGWSSVVDLDRCPDDWLGWLAQLVGVTLIAGATPDESRARIAATDGFWRGTRSAIIAAAGATLTGTKTVYINERIDGDAYHLAVLTLAAETPDAAAAQAAIVAQKPAGLVLDYRTTAGQTYDAVHVRYATYTALRTAYATYDAMRQG
jgi:hypothetical protein